MSVFTVFFSGTGSHRFDDSNPDFWNGELIATLARNSPGREFVDWIAVDGPGSGNLQDDALFVDDGDYSRITGTLFGNGWQENVQHALQVIKGNCSWQRSKLSEQQYQNLKQAGVPIPDATAQGAWLWRSFDYGDRPVTPQALQQQLIRQLRKPLIPATVNLVGWSRGGISCHMLANAMLDDAQLREVAVNIFAIDPVPGVGNVQAERVQLGPNVKEYVGFYARDERSRGFACVVPVVAFGTRVSVFALPGRHATLVGNASASGVGAGRQLPEPGLVVRHFAERCLARWGVRLANALDLGEAELRARHQAMAAQHARYVAMRKHSYTLFSEGDAADRSVHHGLRATVLSAIRGAGFAPPAGLAPSLPEVASYRTLG